ncbi:MAG: hypothetical protein IJI92_00025 [Erysipelotrichaceae bacterium]|nr:hypothetical protein [Erysipelotrichaceae bacterium]
MAAPGFIIKIEKKVKIMKIITQEKIDLKNQTDINEKAIQDYIFDNPSVLGLGELVPIMKEKTQPLGGRLDMLFGDDDNTRYEVELQLGATDPSHIIRTLEYWDIEKKRYPQYDHVAVIIAEDITSRFQNVISLFNAQIPLIAIQMNATKTSSGDVSISFIKVMDRIERGSEDDDNAEPTDRVYWEKRSNKTIMSLVDKVFEGIEINDLGYEKKYNKFYVGVQKDGVAKNYVSIKPKKSYLYLEIKSLEMPEISERIEQAGLDIDYNKRWSVYRIKINKYEDFEKCKEDIMTLVEKAKERYSLE